MEIDNNMKGVIRNYLQAKEKLKDKEKYFKHLERIVVYLNKIDEKNR